MGKLPGKMVGKFVYLPGPVADQTPALNQRASVTPMSQEKAAMSQEKTRKSVGKFAQLAHELAHPKCL